MHPIQTLHSRFLEHIDAVWAIFSMENKLRRLKNIEHFTVPVLTPNGHAIESNTQLEAYCQAVDNEVKTIFEEAYKPKRTQLLKERRKRQQPFLPTTAQKTTTPISQSSFTISETQTRIANNANNIPQPNQHQEVTTPGLKCRYLPHDYSASAGHTNKKPDN